VGAVASLRTIAGPIQHELPRIKGSRFIGFIVRIRSLAAVEGVLAEVRAQLPGATHYAYAARIDDKTERLSDDGEVRGTAARPIHARLAGAGLLNVVLVVVRYYGGTKLGKGGLVRAYGAAAAEVLAAVEVIEEPIRTAVTLSCSYSLSDRLQAQVIREGGVVERVDYDTAVTLTLALPADRPAVLAALLDYAGVRQR